VWILVALALVSPSLVHEDRLSQAVLRCRFAWVSGTKGNPLDNTILISPPEFQFRGACRPDACDRLFGLACLFADGALGCCGLSPATFSSVETLIRIPTDLAASAARQDGCRPSWR